MPSLAGFQQRGIQTDLAEFVDSTAQRSPMGVGPAGGGSAGLAAPRGPATRWVGMWVSMDAMCGVTTVVKNRTPLKRRRGRQRKAKTGEKAAVYAGK